MSGRHGLPDGRTCRDCGKKSYVSRQEARRIARVKHPGQQMNEYRCGDMWHIGHTPPYVKAGQGSRTAYRKREAH